MLRCLVFSKENVRKIFVLKVVAENEIINLYSRLTVSPLIRFQIPASCKSYVFQPFNGPSIAVVISGRFTVETTVKPLQGQRGTVLFIPANKSVHLNCEGQDTELYRAYCVL